MTDSIVRPLKTNKLSLSVQAQQYLLSLIDNGSYQPGDQLPSETELAAQLGISRPTLREALLNLEQEDVLVRKHGVGTFVASGYGRRLESGLERLESILELAARQGMRLGFDALQIQENPAGAEGAEKLRVRPDTLLTSIHRVIVATPYRHDDRMPVAYMVDVVPSSVLSPTDVRDTFNGSVLDLLIQEQDLQISQAVADIVALSADTFLAEKLGVEVKQAVLLIEETLFDDEGLPIGFSFNYFIPEFFHFHIVRR